MAGSPDPPSFQDLEACEEKAIVVKKSKCRIEESPHLSSGLDFLVPSVPTSFRESATAPPSVGQFHSANRPKSRKIGSGGRKSGFIKGGDEKS